MNAAYELAKLLKERENPKAFTVMEGIVEELPDIKVSIGDKVVLNKEILRSTVNLYEKHSDGEYVWLGKRVYILPLGESEGGLRKFLVIGGDDIDC